MLTISHLEVEVCWNYVRILQMLMIFFLRVKPNFAQFSAAYLRHVPWTPERFFSRSAGCFCVAGIPHEKFLARRVYDAQRENNSC